MKELTVVVRPFRAEAVLRLLADAGLDCVVRKAKGYSRQKGYLERYLGSEFSMAFLPKVEITLCVPAERVDAVAEQIAPRGAAPAAWATARCSCCPWPGRRSSFDEMSRLGAREHQIRKRGYVMHLTIFGGDATHSAAALDERDGDRAVRRHAGRSDRSSPRPTARL